MYRLRKFDIAPVGLNIEIETILDGIFKVYASLTLYISDPFASRKYVGLIMWLPIEQVLLSDFCLIFQCFPKAKL